LTHTLVRGHIITFYKYQCRWVDIRYWRRRRWRAGKTTSNYCERWFELMSKWKLSWSWMLWSRLLSCCHERTILYSSIQYNTIVIQYNTIQYNTIEKTVEGYTIQYNTYNTIHYNVDTDTHTHFNIMHIIQTIMYLIWLKYCLHNHLEAPPIINLADWLFSLDLRLLHV